MKSLKELKMKKTSKQKKNTNKKQHLTTLCHRVGWPCMERYIAIEIGEADSQFHEAVHKMTR